MKAREKQILEAVSPEEFEKEVHRLVSQFGVSHIGFRYEGSNGPCWVFQDVHEDGPAFNAGLRAGDLLIAVNGREIGPPEDPEFPMGITMPVTIERKDGQRHSIQLAVPKSNRRSSPTPSPASSPG